MRWAALIVLAIAPAVIAQSEHVQIYVECSGPTPTGLAVEMSKPGTVVIPIRHLELWCERRNGKAS